MKLTPILLALSLSGCALFAPGAPAATALDVVLPVAAKALAAMIQDRYGTAADQSSAVCVPIPDVTDDAGFDYIICRAKPVNGSD